MLCYITCYVVLSLSDVIEHIMFMSCYITRYVVFYHVILLRYITCYVMYVI